MIPRAAALFILGFTGHSAPPALLRRLNSGEIAGTILFSRNFASPFAIEQAAALCESLAGAAGPPPILSVDQEGGRVMRLRHPFSLWPPMARIGQSGPASCERVGAALGAELRLLGINLDFAPVLDIHTNPDNPVIGDRAFGTTPSEVSKRALSFLAGLRSAGVAGCGKHFPGHGDTSSDSHLCLPIVDHPLARLMEVELAPFAAAVAAGLGMIMTAHVVYPALDDRPATLSARWLDEILRRRLGFDGVILSDDMDMGAVAGADIGEVLVESLLAGCDAFLLCKDEERQARAEEALDQAIADRPAVRDRALQSLARLERFRLGLSPVRVDRAGLSSLPDPVHAALAADLR